MTEYLSALRRRLDTHPPDLRDADSVLNLLYEAYSACNPMTDAQIKAGFHELYQLMNGVPLEKIRQLGFVGNISKEFLDRHTQIEGSLMMGDNQRSQGRRRVHRRNTQE